MFIVLLSACASQPLTVTREPVTLRLVASDTCGPLMEELATAYREERPWVTVQVEVFDAAVARERLEAGAADLAALSWLEEEDPFWRTPFATDAVAVVVHPAVPAQGLSLEKLREVFRGRIGEWGDGTPIQVVSREGGSGVRAVFDALVMEGYGVTLTALVAPDTEGMLEAVAATPGAIGYVSWGRLEDGVRVLSVEGLLPGAEGYPLPYSLYLAARGEPEGKLQDFVQWILGPEGQRWVQAHFAPVP